VDGAGFWAPQLRSSSHDAAHHQRGRALRIFSSPTAASTSNGWRAVRLHKDLPSLAFAMGIQGSDLAAGAAISLFLSFAVILAISCCASLIAPR